MPTISEFFGIVIRMYYDDHPPAHFHAHYQDFSALVAIETLHVISGVLPRRALAMVQEWGVAHRADLMKDWNLAQAHEPLQRIEPLE